MRRGDIVTAVLQRAFGKPRPALIVQTDLLNPTHSTTLVCPLTTHPQPLTGFRLAIAPSASNGLRAPSWVLVDKLSLVERGKIGPIIGALEEAIVDDVDEALSLVLGLA